MNKETSEFIKARQPFAENMELKVIDNVKNIGGGVANECYSNSHIAKEKAAKSRKMVGLVSGWLVNKYSKQHNSVSIIAHWWNRDIDGNHFDTTPFVSVSDFEYVQDLAIFKYCYDNDSKLTIHQHYSLAFIDGGYEVLVDSENMNFRKISELRTEYFY